MKRNKILLLALALCLSSTATTSQSQTNRGVGVRVKGAKGQTKEINLYNASYALVIGNSNYTNGWDNLSGVTSDVAAVSKVLERHGFSVEAAENLTARQFVERVSQFISDYGYEPNNRLLIYYAGHGHTLKSAGDGRELGYIVPVDAPNPAKDEIGFRRKAVSMDTIQTYAKEIQAKHALFLFDSCFSGKLVTRNAVVVPPIIQENVAFAVRQFITAGAANQPVPDESIFRRSFVRGLEGEADRNADGYITGTELAEYLKEKVTNYSNRRQTPQYGKINDVELDRGDFVFIIPSEKSVATNVNNALVENEFWDSIKSGADIEDFKLYKEKYPNGIYTNLADLKIRQLMRSSNISSNSSATTVRDKLKSDRTSKSENEYEFLPFSDANDKFGYKDAKGNVVIEPEYDLANYFVEGLALIKQRGKYGFIDKTGKVVIPVQYDEAQFFSNGTSKVKLGAKDFYIDKNGNEIK